MVSGGLWPGGWRSDFSFGYGDDVTALKNLYEGGLTEKKQKVEGGESRGKVGEYRTAGEGWKA